MNSALIVGLGDLGSEIAKLLMQADFDVTGVRYSDKPMQYSMQCIQADVTNIETLKGLENLCPDIVVYCVAANARTDKSYQKHYVQGLNNVLTTQAKNDKLQHVFFVSSTRVYGQNTSAILDEEDMAEASDFGGVRLLEAEALLAKVTCKTTSLRLSGIYGATRLNLLNISKDINKWPSSNKWTNRIHRDDAARFIAFLCEKSVQKKALEDCYIVTDDTPSLQYDVIKWLAKQQGINVSNIVVPPIDGGKKLDNKRLKATGFKLKHSNYKSGYSEILQNN